MSKHRGCGGEVAVSCFIEDSATVTEVWCNKCKKMIDYNYIGATNWEVNRDNSSRELSEFINKYKNGEG